jgi:outer membrane usher protein
MEAVAGEASGGPADAESPARLLSLSSDIADRAHAGELVASVVQVILNGETLADPVIIALNRDEILLPHDFVRLRGLHNAENSHWLDGQEFVPASEIGAALIELDQRGDTLRIDCAADCFRKTVIPVRKADAPKLSPVKAGGFLNYDIFAEGGDTEHRAGALLEAGVFSAAGTGVATLACTRQHSEEDCVRLLTTWTVDRPSAATRLEIGDTITGAGRWEAPARFGGLRIGTDFSLRPDFITFPTPSVSGEAVLPGVVDILVEGGQQYLSEGPAGPFMLTDLPVVTGAGTAELILTDALGRQSVVTADYYTAPQLLKSGLSDWSLEAGFLRKDYGRADSEYEDGFVAAGYARGLSDQFTFEVRSTASQSFNTAGVSGAVSHPGLGVLQASTAVSEGRGFSGNLVDVSHEWRSSAFSLGSSVRYTTPGYRQFGQSRSLPRLTARTVASYSDERMGSLSLSWTHRDEREREDFSTLGIRYTRPLGAMFLNLSAMRVAGQNDATVAAVSLTLPLGGGTSSSISTDYRDGRMGGDARIRKSAPPAGGLGYSGQASTGGINRYEAGVDYRTQIGDASGILSRVENRTAGRLTLRGGAAVVNGTWVAAPSITNSLAVVTVGDQPGVQVFQDRQPVGRTDTRGRIVLTRLRPFERNIVSFDPRDVRIDRTIGVTDAVIVPGFRTGHQVDFNIGHSNSVLAYIVDMDGMPIASNGSLENADSGETYPIGQGGGCMSRTPGVRPGCGSSATR